MGKFKSQHVPTEVELAAGLEAVGYEIQQMLYGWQSYVQPTVPEQDAADHSVMIRNAFLESVLLHMRNLLDFFERPVRRDRRGAELDDVLCSDYRFEARPVPIPEVTRERLNKDLAHISYSRGRRVGGLKDWALPQVLPIVIERCGAFVAHVLDGADARLLGDGIVHQQFLRLRPILVRP